MSKKETEFDRYERMKKLEKEAEVEKRKLEGSVSKKKSGKPKLEADSKKQKWSMAYNISVDDDEYYEV